jgi:hypothetical protein
MLKLDLTACATQELAGWATTVAPETVRVWDGALVSVGMVRGLDAEHLDATIARPEWLNRDGLAGDLSC